LSIGWRPVSTKITLRNASAASGAAGLAHAWIPPVLAPITRRSVLPADSATAASESTSTASAQMLIIKSLLAPWRANPFPVSHAASVSTNRLKARSPARTSASWPTGQSGLRAPTGIRSTAATSAAATTAGAAR
jgi:hypothetical protein